MSARKAAEGHTKRESFPETAPVVKPAEIKDVLERLEAVIAKLEKKVSINFPAKLILLKQEL